MLIDGEKYACEACVRGHRVSNCQHSDRPLTHINKKGRPVSQCTHCRGLRRSRSAHVKCDCGEKSHSKGQCSHADKGDSRDSHACCCSHGAKCNCALKKEILDPVPEIDQPKPAPISTAKPRLTTVQSESSLTVFANGHHKPAHKHNHMAHTCGVPYKIPRSHTVHGTPSSPEATQRSTVSLPLETATDLGHKPSAQKAVIPSQPDARLVKSEQTSPRLRRASHINQLNGQLPPLDLDFPAYDTSAISQQNVDLNSALATSLDYYLATPDVEQSLFSAGLNMPPVDWSTFDLPLDNSTASNPFSQPPSYASFDFGSLSRPEMSASSSGDVSEFGDFSLPGDANPLNPPSLVHSQVPSDSSEVCESDSYRLSTASSYLGLPQTAMLASDNLGSLDIDDFLRAGATEGSTLNESNSAIRNDMDPFTGGYLVDESLEAASRNLSTEDMGLTVPFDSNSPWSGAMDSTAAMGYDPESDMADSVWMS